MADPSGLPAIKAALLALVSAVPGLANVKLGRRLTYDWGNFVNQFQEVDDGVARVNGWAIIWKGQDERRLTTMENLISHRFTISGYYTLREVKAADLTTSEEEFDLLISAITDKIRETHDLSGTSELSSPALVPLKDERLFGGVLCHYCEITIKADERLAGD